MPFNENKRLDPSQVQDRRGRNTGRTVAVGAGGLGIIIYLLSMVLGVDLTQLVDPNAIVSSSSQTTNQDIYDLETECQTGADANQRQDCRIVGYVNSIQAFWTDELASYGVEYIPAQTVLVQRCDPGCLRVRLRRFRSLLLPQRPDGLS